MTNISEVQRLTSALGGALIVRGATDYCPGYASFGVDARESDDTKIALAGSRGTLVETAMTIARPHDELYRFWRRLANLPKFMPHLVSVKELGDTRSHWVAKSLRGHTGEWDAEIVNDVTNERIGWRTLEGADVVSAGSVRFKPTGHDETEVHVRMQYDPPAGKLGGTIREDLRRFKALLETGEVPTTKGQPRGAA